MYIYTETKKASSPSIYIRQLNKRSHANMHTCTRTLPRYLPLHRKFLGDLSHVHIYTYIRVEKEVKFYTHTYKTIQHIYM